MAYQVLDIKTQKGMTEAESAEHLRRNTKEALKFAKRQGNYDFSREHLNFEVTKGGVIPSGWCLIWQGVAYGTRTRD